MCCPVYVYFLSFYEFWAGRGRPTIPANFYTLELNADLFNDNGVFEFSDLKLAKSIFLRKKTKNSDLIDRTDIHNVLTYYKTKETIQNIADFLKKMAEKSDQKIRLYGYDIGKYGYSIKPIGNKYSPSPELDPNKIDPNMPGSSGYSNKFFFEIDPHDENSFTDTDFHRFLSLLLIKHQTFIIRTAPTDIENYNWMKKNEIVFAFSFEKGFENPEEIISIFDSLCNDYIRPLSSLDGDILKISDPDIYFELYNIWQGILENYVFIGFHDYRSYNDWSDACIKTGIHY
jgi:hypothetical protein